MGGAEERQVLEVRVKDGLGFSRGVGEEEEKCERVFLPFSKKKKKNDENSPKHGCDRPEGSNWKKLQSLNL